MTIPPKRAFFALYISYFAYYLCRYNLPVAVPILTAIYGWSESAVGSFFTLLSIVYALGLLMHAILTHLGQFINGHFTDGVNLRWLIFGGSIGSILLNICIYLCVLYVSDSFALFVIICVCWGLNGFMQSTGWPAAVRAMTLYYPDSKQRGQVMAWFATCFQLGGAVATGLSVGLTNVETEPFSFSNHWSLVFLVPSLVFLTLLIIFVLMFRDKPDDRVRREGEKTGMYASVTNMAVMLSAVSYMLLTVARYSFINWLPAYLVLQAGSGQTGYIGTILLAVKLCIHPLCGSLGTIFAGWASDRIFKTRRIPIIVILLALNAVFVTIFPFLGSSFGLVIPCIALIGFCTYGPASLMAAHCAQDFGGDYPAAAAGFIDGAGYIGAAVAGAGIGAIIEGSGFVVAFIVCGCLCVCSAVALSVLIPKETHSKPTIVEITAPKTQ